MSGVPVSGENDDILPFSLESPLEALQMDASVSRSKLETSIDNANNSFRLIEDDLTKSQALQELDAIVDPKLILYHKSVQNQEPQGIWDTNQSSEQSRHDSWLRSLQTNETYSTQR